MLLALKASTFLLAGAAGLNPADLLYVTSQSTNSSIYTYNSAGSQNLFATPGVSLARQIAFDASGNLFLACQGNATILKYDASGNSTVFADSSSGLNGPYGLAFNPSGNLFVSNRGNNTIEEFSPNGVGTVFASVLSQPMSLGFHDGSLYCVDVGGALTRFDGGGTPSLITQLPAGGAFGGIVFDHSGDLFTANSSSLYKITPDGVASVFFDFSNDPSLSATHGLAIDASDNLFVSDLHNTIWEITPDGTRTVFANQASPSFMAVEPVPEPSITTLLIFGIAACACPRVRRALLVR